MTQKSRFNVAYAVFAIFALVFIQYVIAAANRIAVIPYSEYQQLLREGKVDRQVQVSQGLGNQIGRSRTEEKLDGGAIVPCSTAAPSQASVRLKA